MKPNNLPNGWQEVELGEICEVKHGSPITKDKITHGDVPVIAGGQQPAYYHNFANRSCPVITASGSGAYAGFVNYFEIPIFASDCSTIQLKSSEIFCKFIYFLMKSKQNEIYKMQKGIAQPHVYSKDLEKIKILLPPLPLQKKIVSILEKAEILKQKREEADKKTNEYLKSVFYDMFYNKGFEEVELQSIARVINGRAYNQDELLEKGKTPVLRVGNLFSNNNWYYSDLDLEADKYCDKGDLIYAWSASFGPRIWNGPKVIYHYHIWKIELSTKINKNFLFSFLDSKTQEIKSGGHGITMTHITKESMDKMKIPLPPLPLQQKFASIVEKVEKLKEKQKESKEKINEMFDALIQKAFKGEL